jgi:hypothetical protein
VLGRATSNTDTQDSPRLGLGGSYHLPFYSIICGWPQSPHPNGFLSRDSQVGVSKSPKFRESTETPSPKVRVALGVCRFTPSHFLTLLGTCDVTLGLPLGLQPCNPSCFGREPKVRVATLSPITKRGQCLH